jgi:phosphinothricin acetyltransferase
MIIRDAVESDLPTIVEIYNSTIDCQWVTADLQPVTVANRLDWFHRHKPDHRPLWIAENQDEVVGWLGFQSFYSGRPAYHATAELSIYISPYHRRQGIGYQLLETAIAASPNLGIKNLVGFIFANNAPSLKLFQQFGFERWGHLPGVAEFTWGSCDLVIVGLKLEAEVA